MIGRFANEAPTLDDLITEVTAQLLAIGPDSEKYEAKLTYLERLSSMKHDQRKHQASRDTYVVAGSNLLGILLIVIYEQKHVMTTKAWSFRTNQKTP